MAERKYYGPGNRRIELSQPDPEDRNPKKNYQNKEESSPQEKYPDPKKKFREIRESLERQ